MLGKCCERVGVVSRGFFKDLTADASERDLVAIGAGCGIAAAFKAPLSGTMFVIEEASSFFSLPLLWQAFAACVSTYWTVAVWESTYRTGILKESPPTTEFGDSTTPRACPFYQLGDFLFFLLIGCLGGLYGAAFNAANIRIMSWRMTWVDPVTQTPARLPRYLETGAIVLATASVAVFVPLAFDDCTPNADISPRPWAVDTNSNLTYLELCGRTLAPIGEEKMQEVCTLSSTAPTVIGDSNNSVGGSGGGFAVGEENACRFQNVTGRNFHGPLVGLNRFQCEGASFSGSASLFFATGRDIVTSLFRPGAYHLYRTGTLVAFMVVYTLLAVFTSGMALPSGLMMPLLCMGATMGRIVANLYMAAWPYMFGDAPYTFDPCVWAITGAASMLVGSGRITLTMCIILLETSGRIDYLAPLTVAAITSQVTGNAINHGLYHMLMQLQGVPFLHEEPGERQWFCTVGEIMHHRGIVSLRGVETVRHIKTVLWESKHNGFPVVDDDGRFSGIVVRTQLLQCVAAMDNSATVDSSRERSDTESSHYRDVEHALERSGLGVRAPVVTGAVSRHSGSLGSGGSGGGGVESSQGGNVVSPNQMTGPLLDGDSGSEHPLMFKEDGYLLGLQEDHSFGLSSDMQPVAVADLADRSVPSVQQNHSVAGAFNIFRKLGLRHLTVCDSENRVVGILTRKDMLPWRCNEGVLDALREQWHRPLEMNKVHSASFGSQAGEVTAPRAVGRDMTWTTTSNRALPLGVDEHFLSGGTYRPLG